MVPQPVDPRRSGGGAEVVLLVDVANVVGSRPDGWWRDRAGAATRLLGSLASLHDATVAGPNGGPAVHLRDIVAVVEGSARSATGPAGVDVVPAPRDGDQEIVNQAERILTEGNVPLVVTADRGLRARLPGESQLTGAGWLNRLLGR